MTADLPYYLSNNDESILRLFVIRHGQTDANLNKILQGHMDTDLNETGRDQARKLGEYLANDRRIQFDKIYSSDLKRCQQTIETALEPFDSPVKVIKTDKLRERCMGVIEGMYLRDAEKYADSMGKPTFRDFGEPAEEFEERLINVFQDIVKENASNKNLGIISHGGTIRQLLKIFEYKELNVHKIIVFNTSVTIVDYIKNDKEFVVRRVGNTQHLGSGEFIVSDLNLR
ncbi:unnamed protein product [Kluyveromyces dobzhanskii CBS 2104]|uniref:WGS project CCBQ000000000 data, contig 00099 n=1 Tax=Kluyveromyces dobzhanskii CBS 2104 TaxID=1427455 RepID=A0A0A8L452_9SACH|nr:unnamed protein product [Kluyveromyces dobzhanskii CBS 2104]